MEKLNVFSWKVGNLAGTAALAFTVHVNSAPVLKCNYNQQNNKRDVGLSYILGLISYSLIGILGQFGVLGNFNQ